MFKKAVALSVIAVFMAVMTTGCATMQSQEHRGAVTGGAVGAVAGGVLGGVIGHEAGATGTGIILGALLGGLAGAAVGHYGYDQTRSEQQAQQQYNYNYNQAQANLVRLESVKASPRSVRRGGTVDLMATYTVLGPQGATMDVIETREIRRGGELQGKPQITVQRQGGTFESKVPLNLPSDAPKGTYVVATTVQSGGSSDTRESTFEVN